MIEMLTTVAVLVILLGLMVSLARGVRDRSAQVLTNQLLKQLDGLMAQYIEHNGGQLPVVEPLLPDEPQIRPGPPAPPPDEQTLAATARRNNQQCVRAIKLDYRKFQNDTGPAGDPFQKLNLTVSIYDLRSIRDAWGSPVVFMPHQHLLVGMAPSRGGQDQYFFFSAGPDRRYLTRDDNVYSYEPSK
jgi:type II secretory pathway pseudopilin PulG